MRSSSFTHPRPSRGCFCTHRSHPRLVVNHSPAAARLGQARFQGEHNYCVPTALGSRMHAYTIGPRPNVVLWCLAGSLQPRAAFSYSLRWSIIIAESTHPPRPFAWISDSCQDATWTHRLAHRRARSVWRIDGSAMLKDQGSNSDYSGIAIDVGEQLWIGGRAPRDVFLHSTKTRTRHPQGSCVTNVLL